MQPVTNLQWLAVTHAVTQRFLLTQWLSDFSMLVSECQKMLQTWPIGTASPQKSRKWYKWYKWYKTQIHCLVDLVAMPLPCRCPGRTDLGIGAQRPGSALSNSSSGIYTVGALALLRTPKKSCTWNKDQQGSARISKDQQEREITRARIGRIVFFLCHSAVYDQIWNAVRRSKSLNSSWHQFHVEMCLTMLYHTIAEDSLWSWPHATYHITPTRHAIPIAMLFMFACSVFWIRQGFLL